MKNDCLVNHFVHELCSARGWHLEEESELGYRHNKRVMFWINCVIVLSNFLFLLTIVIKSIFLLCILSFCTIRLVLENFPLQSFPFLCFSHMSHTHNQEFDMNITNLDRSHKHTMKGISDITSNISTINSHLRRLKTIQIFSFMCPPKPVHSIHRGSNFHGKYLPTP